MNLNEMSEKDRAFMWRYGLLEIPEFCEEVMSWGDTISYPGNDLYIPFFSASGRCVMSITVNIYYNR